MSTAPPLYVCPSSSSTPIFNLNSLPPETWTHVFEALADPRDLYNVIRTCKYLHSLAIRSLYRNITFNNPLFFLRNNHFWENQNTAMHTVPTSLTVSMPYFSKNAAWGGRFDTSSDLLFPNGSFMPLRAYSMTFNPSYQWATTESAPTSPNPQQSIHNPHLDLSQNNFTASEDTYALLCNRLRTFTNLRELNFQNNALPSELYNVIKQLPSLRKLVFNKCYLPESTYSLPDEFIGLPITELTIKRIKDEDNSQRFRYRRALRMSYAPNITVLDIDWDPVSARVLSGSIPPDIPDKPLPPVAPRLHTLYLYSAGQWPQDAGVDVHLPFEKFLLAHQGIKTLYIRRFNGTPRLRAGILPNLKVYHGPMCTVVPLVATERDDPSSYRSGDWTYPMVNIPQSAATSAIRDVYLTDAGTEKRADKLVKTLRKLAGLPIETLCLPMPKWDLEVMFPLTMHFPNLRRLEIKYVTGSPDEQTILSLGAQFLHRLPHLEVFHLYNPISQRCTCLSSRALEVRLSNLSSSIISTSISPRTRHIAHHTHNTNPHTSFPPGTPVVVAPLIVHTTSTTLDSSWDSTETDPYIISQYTELPLEDLENIAYEGTGCVRFQEIVPRISARRRMRMDVGDVEKMDEEEGRDVIYAWRRWCSSLKEVRMQREWVYRKKEVVEEGVEREEWVRERIRCK